MGSLLKDIFVFMRKHNFRTARWEDGALKFFRGNWPNVGKPYEDASEFREHVAKEWVKLEETLLTTLGHRVDKWLHV